MTDTYVIGSNGKPTILKDPDAILDYSWDWTDWLADVADTISSKTIIAQSPLVVVSSSVVSGIVTAFISGGVVGTTYSVTARINTVGGRIDDRTIYLKVKDR